MIRNMKVEVELVNEGQNSEADDNMDDSGAGLDQVIAHMNLMGN